jgi:hypothetical protein
MGTIVLLSHLSATIELLGIDLVTQQDPELGSPACVPQPLSFSPDLSASACADKNAANRILANRMRHRFAPQKT